MKQNWGPTPPCQASDVVDTSVLEEAALAAAQATIQSAINTAGISRADLARAIDRPRSFISRMMSGSHNLTVKTLARALAACGLEVDFRLRPIQWGWSTSAPVHAPVSAPAGTPVFV